MPLSKNFTFAPTSFNVELHFYISLSLICMRVDNDNRFTVTITHVMSKKVVDN